VENVQPVQQPAPIAQPQPVYSDNNSSGGSNMLEKQITLKQVLIGGGIVLVLWYFYKESKKAAYEKALLDQQKFSGKMAGKNYKNSNDLTSDELKTIQESIHNYIQQGNPGMSGNQVNAIVLQLTKLS
jgi:hypothetical protein